MGLSVSSNVENFINEIHRLVNDHNLDVMDAVIHYCEKTGVEIETAAAIIRSNPRIKSRLQSEAEDLNFLPKKARLKFDE